MAFRRVFLAVFLSAFMAHAQAPTPPSTTRPKATATTRTEPAVEKTATDAAIRKICLVAHAEKSNDVAQLNTAYSCVRDHVKTLINQSDAAAVKGEQAEELKGLIEDTLTYTDPAVREKMFATSAKLSGATTPPQSAAPKVSASAGSRVPQTDTSHNNQAIRESAFGTPTACDRSNNPKGGGDSSNAQGVISVHRTLVMPKDASDDFGYRLGRRFFVYQVTVTNTSTEFQYELSDISVDLSDIYKAQEGTAYGAYQRYLASAQDLSMLRGVPEKGQDYDKRNMTLHIFQGIGSVAAGVSGLTTFPDVMGPAVANFNGAFIQAFTGIAPDHTSTQLNRLSDKAFTANTLIERAATKTFAIFIPEALLFEKNDTDLYWKDPNAFLSGKSVIRKAIFRPKLHVAVSGGRHLEQLDVCVDGQMLAPVATTATPVFTTSDTSFDAASNPLLSPTDTITLGGEADASVYYTTDGSQPTAIAADKYTTPIAVNPVAGSVNTVQAFSVAPNKPRSAIVSVSYTTRTASPTFTPSDTSALPASVTLKDSTPGSTIYYTTDGTDPKLTKKPYSTAIPLTATTTIQAYATSSAPDSDVVSITYTKP